MNGIFGHGKMGKADNYCWQLRDLVGRPFIAYVFEPRSCDILCGHSPSVSAFQTTQTDFSVHFMPFALTPKKSSARSCPGWAHQSTVITGYREGPKGLCLNHGTLFQIGRCKGSFGVNPAAE
jgi:hypothetical protein